MNVWVSKINSEEMAQPGDPEWEPARMRKYWGKVWTDCKDLSQHLQGFEVLAEQIAETFKEPADTEQPLMEVTISSDGVVR